MKTCLTEPSSHSTKELRGLAYKQVKAWTGTYCLQLFLLKISDSLLFGLIQAFISSYKVVQRAILS